MIVNDFEVSASDYAMKIFFQWEIELLSYEKDHPELSRRECLDALFSDVVWKRMS